MASNKSILEALLFMSPEPLSVKEIMNILENAGESDIISLLSELSADYETRDSGIQVVEVGEGWRMLTRLECSPWLKKLKNVTVSGRLSQPGMETLSIIAYRQPVIKAEIDQIRGVSSDGVLRTLLDRKLIKILGRKEMPGRPLLYGTTTEFLQYFGLKSISELPTLKDLEDIDGSEPPEFPTMAEVKEMDAAGFVSDPDAGVRIGEELTELDSKPVRDVGDATRNETEGEMPVSETDGDSPAEVLTSGEAET